MCVHLACAGVSGMARGLYDECDSCADLAVCFLLFLLPRLVLLVLLVLTTFFNDFLDSFPWPSLCSFFLFHDFP